MREVCACVLLHPSFFFSKKVQVEWPELESGGNAQAFIVILKHGRLEIGLRRDFRDFAIFLIHFRFLQGSNLGPLDPKASALTVWPRGQRGRSQKILGYD